MKDSSPQRSVMEEILEYNRDREPRLLRLKLRRMAHDPFAFFRGTDHLFAKHWSRLAPPDVGPSVLICGDLHLENFGAYRADDGTYLYDINDFDEALVGPCTLDLVRCATSILLAAELWQHTPVQALRTLLAFLDRYRVTVTKSIRTGRLGEMALGTARGPIWRLLQRPAVGDQTAFLAQFTERGGAGATRRIERASERFRSVGRDLQRQIREAVEKYGAGPRGRKVFQVDDVAFRVAGTGSLGLQRYVALVRDRQSHGLERLLDIKEARPSALLPCASGETQPDYGGAEARRVVLAQQQLQAKPTARLDVLELGGQLYRVRELIPEENRTGLDRLRKRPRRLRRAVAVAGRLAGWAHVRGSRLEGRDRSADLARWADGPGLDAVIASAVRYADRTRRDYKAFCLAADTRLVPGGDR
jgi:uncharacterized protein (DUF2252 family)